jgi:hypothetical protein
MIVHHFQGRPVRQGSVRFWEIPAVSSKQYFAQKIFGFSSVSDQTAVLSRGKRPKVLLPFSIDFHGFPTGKGDFS